MYLMRRDPSFSLPTFDSLQEEMNRVFDSALGQRLGNGGTRTWGPPVEIFETGDNLVVSVELPGFEKDEINISFEDGRLNLSGERKVPEDEGRNVHRNERWYGRFERSFVLPTAYDASKIEAKLHNGILTVVLPKSEEQKARQIPVSVSG